MHWTEQFRESIISYAEEIWSWAGRRGDHGSDGGGGGGCMARSPDAPLDVFVSPRAALSSPHNQLPTGHEHFRLIKIRNQINISSRRNFHPRLNKWRMGNCALNVPIPY